MQDIPDFPFPADHALQVSPLLAAARAGEAPVRVQLPSGSRTASSTR